MNSVVKKLKDDPVIIIDVRPNQDVEAEVSFNISFSEIVMGMASKTKGTPGTLSDPRIKPVFVGTRDMVELGAQAGRQAQYGALDILLFATLDDALAHIRREVSQPA